VAEVYSAMSFDDDDELILVPGKGLINNNVPVQCFTAYKRIDKKVKPLSTTFPEEACVKHQIPMDPLTSLAPLSKCPPEFTPTSHLTQEHIDSLKINPDHFLSEEEEKLFIQVMINNEKALAFVKTDRGTLKEEYFSLYIMATVPHTPWEYKNIPIPPGIRDKVIELLKEKIATGVYKSSQSSY
jgi:hypothetical protein